MTNRVIDTNLVQVFSDAAECECAVLREGLFNEINPYVILKDVTLGCPAGVEFAPAATRNAILAKAPEPNSTWMRIQTDDWTCINAADEDTDFDGVFRSCFVERLKGLAYVLTALGCRKISLESRERHTNSFASKTSGAAKVNEYHPGVDGSVDSSFERDDAESYRTLVEQTLCLEYKQYDEIDVAQAEKILVKYGFGRDLALRSILDSQKLGRKGPPMSFHYTFSGTFSRDYSERVSAALKLSAKVKKINIGANVDAKLAQAKKKHDELAQFLSIRIENR